MDNNYLGEVVSLCTAMSWSIGVFFFTDAARKLGPNSVNHFRLVLAVLFLTGLAWLIFGINPVALFRNPTLHNWIWFGLSGVVGLALGDYFSFTSFAILGTRLSTLFATLAPGAALLFGFFLLGERINMTGIFGMLVTLGGVALVILSKKEDAVISTHFGKKEKGVLFGILAAVCQGVGLVMAKKGMEGLPVPAISATWIRMIVATVLMYIFTAATGKLKEINQPVRNNQNKGIFSAVLGTIFGPVIGVSCSMYAVSLINASVAQTIFSLVPVLVLPGAYFFYHEKITLRSVIGAVVAIAGVMILIWRDKLAEGF